MKDKSVSDHWNDIFNDYSILETIKKDGCFYISAQEIKKHKEPRLMTKFDHSKNRPEIFKKNKLGILPVDNGMYVIGKFSLYKTLPKTEDDKPKFMKLPSFLESIDPENIYSENNALNVALLSGMISDLVGEDVYETISGRMRSSKFSFYVNSENEKSHIEVKKPQIEIDGGFESTNNIIVVEAKNSQPEDFIIRQLYYPYRFWKMKVNKEILPVFFTYKNGVYTFYIYKFKEDDNYSSIELVEKLSYVIDYENIHIIKRNKLDMQTEGKDVPFPQADTFNRVKELIDLIADGYKTAKEIAEFYDIAQRQG
ncbi:MAG: type II restriction enzyme, partial [bacterium]